MKNHLPFIILLFLSLPCFGQESFRLSSQQNLHGDSARIYKQKKLTFDFQFDNRNSFIRNNAVNIQGLNMGFNFASGIRWGIGAYKIIKPFQLYRNVDQQQVTTNRELDLTYVTPNFQYTFFDRKWIQASVILEVGFGTVEYKILNKDKSIVLREKRGFFLPGSSGLDVLIIPFRWFALEGLIGYRKSLRTYEINKDFDGIFYSYGVKVFLGSILKDLRYHSAKRKHKKIQGN